MIAAILIVAAFLLNIRDLKSLLLLGVITSIVYAPFSYIEDYRIWYLSCIAADCFIAVLSYYLKSQSSIILIPACVVLVCSHIASWLSTSMFNYHTVAVTLELLQIISLIITSPIVLSFLTNAIIKLIKIRGFK